MSCSNGYDFSSPENTYDSYIKAVEKKDIEGMSKCFDSEVVLYSKENIKILANKLFNEVNIESHKIINIENLSETEIGLIVEEVMKRENIKTKSTIRIKFKNINGDWKICSTETLAFNPEVKPVGN